MYEYHQRTSHVGIVRTLTVLGLFKPDLTLEGRVVGYNEEELPDPVKVVLHSIHSSHVGVSVSTSLNGKKNLCNSYNISIIKYIKWIKKKYFDKKVKYLEI